MAKDGNPFAQEALDTSGQLANQQRLNTAAVAKARQFKATIQKHEKEKEQLTKENEELLSSVADYRSLPPPDSEKELLLKKLSEHEGTIRKLLENHEEKMRQRDADYEEKMSQRDDALRKRDELLEKTNAVLSLVSQKQETEREMSAVWVFSLYYAVLDHLKEWHTADGRPFADTPIHGLLYPFIFSHS